MKKLVLSIVLLAFVQLAFAQNLQSDFSSEINKSGEYLQKATSDLYVSVGAAVLSGACFYWNYSIKKNSPEDKAMLPQTLGIGFAAASLVFYVAHIVHVGKAGDHLIEADRLYKKQQKLNLSLQSNSDGIGLALKF